MRVPHLRIRLYFGFFGVIGFFLMLGYLPLVSEVVAAYEGSWFSPFAKPLLLGAQLAQAAACLGYAYVAFRYRSLLHEESPWPRRLIWLSMVAAALSTCFRGLLMGGPAALISSLSLLLNLGYNVSLLRLLKSDEEALSKGSELPEL